MRLNYVYPSNNPADPVMGYFVRALPCFTEAGREADSRSIVYIGTDPERLIAGWEVDANSDRLFIPGPDKAIVACVSPQVCSECKGRRPVRISAVVSAARGGMTSKSLHITNIGPENR